MTNVRALTYSLRFVVTQTCLSIVESFRPKKCQTCSVSRDVRLGRPTRASNIGVNVLSEQDTKLERRHFSVVRGKPLDVKSGFKLNAARRVKSNLQHDMIPSW